MRAISLWQPWASLIGRGKEHETRSWPTRYRGPIAIHAAKRWTREEKEICRTEPFATVLSLALRQNQSGDFYFDEMIDNRMPLGAIVAVAELTDCIPTDRCRRAHQSTGGCHISELDFRFGDFSPGRYAWKLANIQLLDEPIPLRGSQGLFDVPDAILRGG